VTSPARLPFTDLRPREDAAAVRDAIDRVVARGWFVLGPEVEAFEAELAAACGTRFAVGVASGTDALALILRTLALAPDDEVIVPAMTAGYTALAVIAAGARPVIVDVSPQTLTLDPDACADAITPRTRAIVPVHLYGQPADMRALRALAARRSLAIVEDCCQAHLATEDGAAVATRAVGGALSFYPTKNLGALGDGGAVLTNDAAVADRVRRLRNGGRSADGRHAEAGVNSRLDEMQAAILRARLPFLRGWTERRRRLAARYRRVLPAETATIREVEAGHVYHLFPIRDRDRDALRTHLAASGIETLIHYPAALSEQDAFAPFARQRCAEAAAAARELVSLPLHPALADADVERVAHAVAQFRKGRVLA
jgi:dTDP-3-amino-3,4,6-trideoxy-alpha-D-glucose transaminase